MRAINIAPTKFINTDEFSLNISPGWFSPPTADLLHQKYAPTFSRYLRLALSRVSKRDKVDQLLNSKKVIVFSHCNANSFTCNLELARMCGV